jgi:CRP/FNR family cyclic AMP-dependent transcriptional regulator
LSGQKSFGIIMRYMSVVTKIYKAGQTLFTEGEPSRSIFIVKKGALSIRKKKGKAFIEVGKILSNEVLGELSFFDRQPRSATAVALMEVEVLEISFESMEKIYNSIPDYLKTIIASLADRLRKANEVIQTIQDSRS